MSDVLDPALTTALATLSAPGVRIGHRVIQPGDEKVLFETEAKTVSALPDKRRASGSARLVGRALLKELGATEQPIPRRVSGAPLWPDGITGSFAHDHLVAVAALARTRDVAALGIDVEPAVALPADMLDLVTNPKERIGIDGDPLRGRVLFVVKEAVYKAVHPQDGKFLDYHDIAVDLSGGTARTKNRRALDVRYCVSTHVVAVVWIAAAR